MAEEQEKSFQERLFGELDAPGSFSNSKEYRNYRSSLIQKETYESLQREDLMYQKFITQTYGSYENFLQQNKLLQNISIFDPTVDYIVDVTVVTEEAFFKTDHISSQEVILENLSGLCTVWFTKRNGSVRKLNCTLDTKYLPTKEYRTRSGFFSPMAGDRVGVWDLTEGGWKSFYMNSVIKFVRDDTSGIE